MISTDDLSFQAFASQSPEYIADPSSYNLYKASNALDRNTATCMRTDDIGKKCRIQVHMVESRSWCSVQRLQHTHLV